MANGFIYVNSRRPCQVCGSPRECRENSNGTVHCHTIRESASNLHLAPDSFQWVGDSLHGTFGMFRRDGGENGTVYERAAPRCSKPLRPSPSPAAAPTGRTMSMVEFINKNKMPLNAFQREQLAGALGLPTSALLHQRIWWLPNDTRNSSAWVFEEVDGAGQRTGYALRYADGMKIAHGPRGLFVPNVFWRDTAETSAASQAGEPVYVVEGASDTIALMALGLIAVGRPSNMGGVAHLAELLAGIPTNQPIVVMGENDAKPISEKHPAGLWPGRDGALHVAKELAKALGREILVAFPPTGSKDARAWVVDRIGTRENSIWANVWRNLTAAKPALVVQPPANHPDNYCRPDAPPYQSPYSDLSDADNTREAAQAAHAERDQREQELEALAAMQELRKHQFTCRRPYRRTMEHVATFTPAVFVLRCDRLDCPGCGACFRAVHKENVSLRLTLSENLNFAMSFVEPEKWAAKRQWCWRVGANYFCVRTNTGHYLVVSDKWTLAKDARREGMATGADGTEHTVSQEQAVRVLHAAIDQYTGDGRPVSSSRAWAQPQPEKTAPQWIARGLCDPAVNDERLGEVAKGLGCTIRERRPRNAESLHTRLKRQMLFDRPGGWNDAEFRNHFLFCLQLGEVIPYGVELLASEWGRAAELNDLADAVPVESVFVLDTSP